MKNIKQAWLSPKGKLITNDKEFIHAENLENFHQIIGLCVIRDLENLPHSSDALKFLVRKGLMSATEYLENIRWIRLHKWDDKTSVWVKDLDPLKQPTLAQEEVIAEWGIAHNKKFTTCFL